MRTLPDNPSLDHLRQQAKDLLAGLRDCDPAASLSAAQASLAQQYGFRSWTELKTEVDRICGRADLADPQLAQTIAERFGLGEVIAPMRSMAHRDHMGRPYALVTEQSRWMVRTTDNWIPIVDAETDFALQEAAAAAGVLLPAPVRSPAGAIVEEAGGHGWRCYRWRHSGPPLAAPVSVTHTYAVGGILATVHGLRLPVDRISPWHAARLSQVSWADLAAEARARGAGWAGTLAEAVPTLVDLDLIGQAEPISPPVLCHNALGPVDVRLGPRGRLIVFDWERAGGQPPNWELGDVLMHWTVGLSGRINVTGARALVDGYRAQAGQLPPLDITAFSGAASSMGNYVYEEVRLALDATDAEQRHYAERSVRHVLARLPSRGLFERILDATGA